MIQKITPPGPPDVRATLFDLISSLPVAAMASDSTSSAAAKQRLLPILRKRVEFLSSSSGEPWLRLLTYQANQVDELSRIARSEELQPHPVSGEVEIDWDSSQLRYKRVDPDTFQAMVILKSLNLFFCLTYFPGDSQDSEPGWRVSEVGVAEPTDSPGSANPIMEPNWGGSSSIADAEAAAESTASSTPSLVHSSVPLYDSGSAGSDDEDDYWEQYNGTPSLDRGISMPSSMPQQNTRGLHSTDGEDSYYAQYDQVQPALDNHDPDEAAAHNLTSHHPPLGLAPETKTPGDQRLAGVLGQVIESVIGNNHSGPILTPPDSHSSVLLAGQHSGGASGDDAGRSRSSSQRSQNNDEGLLLHPRPSSRSSSVANSVSKLEERAERQDHVESSIKQHVGRNIRSLFELCRANGIDREEFERIVTTELDVFPIHDLED